MTDLKDLLRLELDRDDVANAIANHSGVVNTGGWSFAANITGTVKATSTLLPGAFKDRYAIIATTTVTQYVEVFTPSIPVTAGQFVVANVMCGPVNPTPAGSEDRAVAHVVFVDGSNVIVSQTQGTPGAYDYFCTRETAAVPLKQVGIAWGSAVTVPVPAGAVTARLRIQFQRNGNPVPASTAFYLSKATMHVGTAVENLRYAVFTDPAEMPLDLLGKSNAITVHRGSTLDGVNVRSELGTIDATILDPTVDPAINPRMRAGRPVRLSALSGGTWKPLASGKIGPLKTRYSRDGKPIVSLTAADANADIAKASSRYRYASLGWTAYTATLKFKKFRWFIDAVIGADTPYPVGKGVQPLTDDLQLLRNGYADHLWVDKINVLRMVDALPTTPLYVFTDSPSDVGASAYSEIDVNFGTDVLVNALTVNKISVLVDTGLGETEKLYGPYVNDQSVAEWGQQTEEFEVTVGNPLDQAKRILAQFDTPARAVKSLTLPVFSKGKLNPTHLETACGIETLNAVRVKYAPASLDTIVRVLSIDHIITPTTWQLKLTFMPIEVESTIVVTPPAAGDLTGPDDIAATIVGPLAERSRTTNLNLGNGALTKLPFDAQHNVAEGIAWNGTNSEFVAPVAGRYLVTAALAFNGNATGVRVAEIQVNGSRSAQTGFGAPPAAIVPIVPVIKAMVLAAGDVVSIHAYQTSGGTLALRGDGTRITSVTITYLGQ